MGTELTLMYIMELSKCHKIKKQHMSAVFFVDFLSILLASDDIISLYAMILVDDENFLTMKTGHMLFSNFITLTSYILLTTKENFLRELVIKFK